MLIFAAVGLQIRPNRYHLNSEQFGELRFASSYASQHLRLNSSDTGVGCSMCQRKRSASLPVNTGVSLIGLAIIVTVLWFLRLQGRCKPNAIELARIAEAQPVLARFRVQRYEYYANIFLPAATACATRHSAMKGCRTASAALWTHTWPTTGATGLTERRPP